MILLFPTNPKILLCLTPPLCFSKVVSQPSIILFNYRSFWCFLPIPLYYQLAPLLKYPPYPKFLVISMLAKLQKRDGSIPKSVSKYHFCSLINKSML